MLLLDMTTLSFSKVYMQRMSEYSTWYDVSFHYLKCTLCTCKKNARWFNWISRTKYYRFIWVHSTLQTFYNLTYLQDIYVCGMNYNISYFYCIFIILVGRKCICSITRCVIEFAFFHQIESNVSCTQNFFYLWLFQLEWSYILSWGLADSWKKVDWDLDNRIYNSTHSSL